jgi:hypothetical protein
MKILRDFQDVAIRLTEERLLHILEHPEMVGMEAAITQTLSQPQQVVQSLSDPEARLYYRFYYRTVVGDKFLCVVVKIFRAEGLVLTAYLTDKVKKGLVLWPKTK